MHIDAQTKSLHYIQMYSVKDRIDFGKLSDVCPTDGKSLYDYLSSTEDYEKLKFCSSRCMCDGGAHSIFY